MSGRRWKPGDVAVVDCRGESRIATFTDDCHNHEKYGEHPAEPHWHVHSGRFLTKDDSRRARPLVVIDPEDREQCQRLVTAMNDHRERPSTYNVQAALRSLVTPPKPDEPTGLGAVVEDEQRWVWVRRCCGGGEKDMSHPWLLIASFGEPIPAITHERSWSALAAVKVLSKGVPR